MHARSAERRRKEPLTSLVIPVYNPGSSIDRTWEAVQSFLHTTPGSWEVLFVCDGCTDGAAERLTHLTGTQPRVRVVQHAINRGKGYAVRRGLAEAQGDWRLFTDVDLAYDFPEVIRVANALWSGADVAVASRAHPESRVIVPPELQGYAYRRHVQGLIFSKLARLLLPVRQKDTQAGLKGMTAEVAQTLLPHLTCDGFGFDCELLTACVRLGIRVSEIPVRVRFLDRGTTTTLRSSIRMISELWQVRRIWRQAPAVLVPARLSVA